MGAIINYIEYYLPERTVSNEQLIREYPEWDLDNFENRSGVYSRHIAAEDETALDLAYKACEKMALKFDQMLRDIDCIIFCTQTPDYIMPPNSCLLHKLLDLPQNIMSFDINLACSGFVYGVGISQALLISGTVKKVLLVNSDTYSKIINKGDRSARILFGDGAAATILSESEGTSGVIDAIFSTAGKQYDKFIIPVGGFRVPKSRKTSESRADNSGNLRSQEDIHMDGMGILAFVSSEIPRQVKEILSRNGIEKDNIKLFIFHQASKMVLDSLKRILKIKDEKIYSNISQIGNTVSASIPIALKDAQDSGLVHRGDKVILSGFGVGLSWGTLIIEM
ncbi:MAG: 3-oxoacyl-ACP synthase III family protein [Candidatus Kariarchaeaceae archaeon]|jgi:3-oxoacyl-[acyl-carrier-protein] synthase-3